MSDYTAPPAVGRMDQAPRARGMSAEPGSTENPPLEPVLFEDIDPILLAKVHGGPDATSKADMEAAAIAQGQETAAAGAVLEASHQEPVTGAPEPPPPVP